MGKKNKKILVIASDPRSLVLFRGSLIKKTIKLGHTVYASAPGYDNETIEILNNMGVRFIPITLSRRGLNIFGDIKLFFALCKIIRKIKPHIMLAYTIKPVIYGSLAAYFGSVKNIYSIITGVGFVFYKENLLQRILSIPIRLLYRISLSINKTVFFQNKDDQFLFEKLSIITKNNNVILINGSGVDTDYYCFSKSNRRPISFLLISRLLKQKGINEFIEAAKLLKNRYPEVIFQIIGTPERGPSAISEEELNSIDIKRHIDYLGYKKDVRPWIEGCSVYVLPSYREGTPRTVLEAMSMGRPIITTDTAGCRETVKHSKNGFLIPTRDSIALAGAMEKFIQNPSLIQKMGIESRKIAEDKYDVHKVNKNIMNAMDLS